MGVDFARKESKTPPAKITTHATHEFTDNQTIQMLSHGSVQECCDVGLDTSITDDDDDVEEVVLDAGRLLRDGMATYATGGVQS